MQLSGFQNAIIKPLSHKVDQRSSSLIAQLKRPCMEFANNLQYEGLNTCFFLLVYKIVMVSYPKEVITGIWCEDRHKSQHRNIRENKYPR